MSEKPSITEDIIDEVELLKLVEDDKEDTISHYEYERALDVYLYYKSKYDSQLQKEYNKIVSDEDISKKNKISKVRNIKMKCIYCKRKVNTIFEERDRTYIAYCGDSKKPCKLDIRIKKPQITNYIDEYTKIKDTQDDLNKQITILKLKYLFNHIDDTSLEEQFKNISEEKQSVNELYTTLQEEIEKLHNSITRDNKSRKLRYYIDTQLQKLVMLKNEYNTTIQTDTDSYKRRMREIINEIVEIYYNNIKPFVKHLRENDYDYIGIENTDTEKGNKVILTKNKYTVENNNIFLEPYEIISLTTK